KSLQQDLNNFARMVDQAPPGALDPESSNYLFHSGSAAAKGKTTSGQNATMGDEYSARRDATAGRDYSTTSGTPEDRPVMDQDIINEPGGTTASGNPNYGRDVMGKPDTSRTQGAPMPPENT